MRTFTAVIERDAETGVFVGYVPGWPGAHSQGDSVEELRNNLAEVVVMLLEDGDPKLEAQFVGTEQLRVAWVGSVPVLKPREVELHLFRHGFSLVRQRGSHRQYRHADGRGTTVPFHARDIAPSLLRKIAKDVGLSVDQLIGEWASDSATDGLSRRALACPDRDPGDGVRAEGRRLRSRRGSAPPAASSSGSP